VGSRGDVRVAWGTRVLGKLVGVGIVEGRDQLVK